jgi:hypothetical protein
VDPVPAYLDDETRARLGHEMNLEEFSQYLHDTMVRTLEPHYPVVGVTPGLGTGRIRMALTYLRKGGPFNTGAVAIECEVLDSQTGAQLAALREIRKGKSSSLSKWTDAKDVMDDRAREFYATLEKEHGRGPRPQAVFTPPPQAPGK